METSPEPEFYYVVRARLIRFIKNDKFNFIEFEETFLDDSPIIARTRAFEFYQNYIDVLLEANNETYYSDKQAREKLLPFYYSSKLDNFKFGDQNVVLKDSLSFGIGVFMKLNDSELENSKTTIDGVELHSTESFETFIHGIGNIHYMTNDPEALLTILLSDELKCYEYFNYSTGGQVINITFFSRDKWRKGYGHDQTDTYRILRTPFDWSGYDQPFWWGEEKVNIPSLSDSRKKSLYEIITLGESNQVEFKPTLLYNFKTMKAGIGVKYIISRTICAFLNSNGGYLFIGVTDDGTIQGLDYDFRLSEGKDERDFFRLEFDQMIKHFLSFVIMSEISGDYYELEGKTIFVVTVHPSFYRPIFLKGQKGKEFYVRGEASTRKLEDIEDITNYCINKWGRKK